MRTTILAGVAAGTLLVGAAGAVLVQPAGVDAADPTPTPAVTATAAPTAGATSTPTTAPTTAPTVTPDTTGTTDTSPGCSGREHGPGLDTDDIAAAAKALGMTEAALTTELEAGKTAAQVATAKGVDVQKVIEAVVASDTAEIKAAVTAGTMTQAQADERLANLTQHVTDEVNGVADGRGGHHGPGGLDADDLMAAAKVLGMTEAALTAELEAGKTAAQVATAKGVDVQKVIDAVVASDTAEIKAAVTAGTMTQAQADERLANLTQHVTDEVNGVAGMGRGGHGGHGPGGPHGALGEDGQVPAASPTTGTGTGTGA